MQPVRGTHDLLPDDYRRFAHVVDTARDVARLYGYREMATPIFEFTELFARGIGETTDVVSKEMYTFADRGNESLTLRPEYTAGICRAFVSNGELAQQLPLKVFAAGPMFRYERPQKGRFRQFYQIGAEAFGVAAAAMDAELIILLRNLLEAIGLSDLNFEINSIGCADCRPAYRQALLDFFGNGRSEYCPDCQRRYETNPLRILDCKLPRCGELRQGAPTVKDHLCGACRTHFDEVLAILNAFNIPHTLNLNLVRGLDYYTKTTFEVTSEHLGAQKAVAAGGRYDRLVEEFGGPATPAIGFALGMERIVTLLNERNEIAPPGPKVFVATLGKDAEMEGFRIAETLRAMGIWAEQSYGSASLKSQLRRADRLSAEFALIIGDNELKAGKLQWKNLRKSGQGEIAPPDVAAFFADA